MAEILDFPPDAVVPQGLFALAGLPQRGSVSQQAFGTGWPEFDSILKFYLGQFIVVTGIPGHGKSTFMLNVLLKLAIERRVGSFMYVPENEGHLREKLRLMWPGDQASFDYFCREQCIVQSSRLDHSQDIGFVLDRAAWAVENFRSEIIFLDPWNELDRARGRDETMTDYIGRCLIRVKDFCRTRNVIVIIVAHPTKVVTQNGGRVVGLADIEGSMNWFNKCDNGLIVVRDSATNTAKVISAKVREIGAGRIGSCSFTVDPNTGIFTPQYGSDFDA